VKAEVPRSKCSWGAYIWYVEHFAIRYDAGDRTFYDAIKILSKIFSQNREQAPRV
jgi:hypothetical protein